MRLRPSTPLSVLLAAAFALLLISVLSTPIISSIPLGEIKGDKFGVFGYCQSDGSCSSIGIGYDASALDSNNDAFDLPTGARQTLSSILILHPVAAILVLIMFILAVTSHFHAPSHSARYLLALFVFTVITFLVCLASFLIDVLLFIPNMAWGSWIVLASTVMVAVSGVVTCAMRRSLISRKTRRKKIAENAEMSGENFYNRQGPSKPLEFTSAPPPAPLSTGANGGANDSLPAFATFEDQRKEDSISDERIPLTQRSPSAGPANMAGDGEPTGLNAPRRSPSRDRFGNPINPHPDAYGVSRGPSMESMRSRGSFASARGGRGYGGGRGGLDPYSSSMRSRGGYGPPSRGGYPPRGRGGLAPGPRGGYAPVPMRGGRSPPPPQEYTGYYDGRPAPAEPYGPYGQRPSDGYSTNPSNNPSMPSVNAGYDSYNPSEAPSYPRAESPPPMVGNGPGSDQAIEMDATPADNQGYVPYNEGLRDNDSDVAGMIGLQQGRSPERHDTYMSEGSKYSSDEQFYPARAAWNQGEGRGSPGPLPPLNVKGRAQPSPASRDAPPPATPGTAGDYYEDIDPRFANPSQASLEPPPMETAYDDAHAANSGARSPVGSERSNFTSISQRGVNPRWNPHGAPPPMPHQQGPPPRRPVQQRQDMILDNPDFQVPGARPGPRSRAGPRGGPGMVPGSAYPAGL